MKLDVPYQPPNSTNELSKMLNRFVSSTVSLIMLIPPIRDVLILLSFSGLLGIFLFVAAPGQRDGTVSSLYSSRFYLSAHKRHACPPTSVSYTHLDVYKRQYQHCD